MLLLDERGVRESIQQFLGPQKCNMFLCKQQFGTLHIKSKLSSRGRSLRAYKHIETAPAHLNKKPNERRLLECRKYSAFALVLLFYSL